VGMSQRINDGALLRYSAAELIAFVTRTTLAEISTWSADELQRIGWTGNALVDILYSMTYPAGVWISRVDTSGRVEEKNSSSIYGYTQLMHSYTARPVISPSLSPTVASQAIRRIAIIPYDTGAGGVDYTEVMAALAGYYGVFVPLAFTTDVAAATELQWYARDEDATPAAIMNLGQLNIDIAADMDMHMISFWPEALQDNPPPVFTAVDNKALQIQMGNLGNNKTGLIYGIGWYET